MKLQTVLGKKVNMTTRFDAKGIRVPVTLISVEPNVITQIRTQDTDGYMAVQLGVGAKKYTNKPMLGHFKKANLEKAPRFIKEARFSDIPDVEVGSTIQVTEVIEPGDMVSVQGISKGKGFQGGIKRWGFHGGPASHGQSDRHRAPGSIGSGTTPGRVYRGKKMAGRMGNDAVTVKNLAVFDIDEKNNLIEVMGSIPGARGGFVVVDVIGKNKKHIGPAKKEEEELVVEENLTAKVEAGAEEVFEAETQEPEEISSEASGESSQEEASASAEKTEEQSDDESKDEV